ncbi:ABC transporter ATP-binding protein [Kitasatospora sp. NPDC096147]|uniref:ABC transporter ATP-binding protein n=1 Tax=Kitasatospora sp. NPDC096147 TaxID=3364093 RepID=UPI00381E29E4
MTSEPTPPPVADDVTSPAVLSLDGVSLHRPTSGQAVILDRVDWTVRTGQHWALLGANGAGKTTLLKIVGAVTFPTSGTVEVFGSRFGRVDLRELRARIGLVSSAQRVPAEATAHTVVLTGATGTVQPVWQAYDPATHERAHRLLAELGLKELTDRRFGDCSSGQRARILISRALMADPALLLLDEPFNALDLPSREDLIDALSLLSARQPGLTTITVTHHLEELPPNTTHALLLRDGRVLASGPVATALTSDHLSACFGRPVRVTHDEGRWYARSGR